MEEGKADDGVAVQEDGSLLLTGPTKRGDERRFRLDSPPGWLAALRLEVLPHEAHKDSILRNGAESTLIQLSATWRTARMGQETRLTFADADADLKDERYANGSAILGVKTGWMTSSHNRGTRQTSVWLLDRPIQLAEGDQLIVSVESDERRLYPDRTLAVQPLEPADDRHR